MILTFNLFHFSQNSNWCLYPFYFSSFQPCYSCWFLCLFSTVLLQLFLLLSKSVLNIMVTHFRACQLNLLKETSNNN